jgi:hypothetical protein
MNLLKSRSVNEQRRLDGDERGVQQPLLHTTVRARLRGKSRGQSHIAPLNDIRTETELRIEQKGV